MKQGDVTTQDQAALLPISKPVSTTKDLTQASGTVAYTGVGFKPSFIEFFCTVGNSAGWSYGTTSVNGSKSIYTNDASHSEMAVQTLTCIHIYAGSGLLQYAQLSSMDTDGFTLNWTKSGSPTGTATISFIAHK